MSSDFLGDRRRALEDSFFAQQDRQLLDRLREEVKKEDLAKASGITDEAVLDSLVEAGFSADAVAALALAPLVAVAWADGKLDDKEREALLQSSSSEGIEPGSPSHDLFQGWLASAPGDDLVPAWKSFVAAASQGMGDAAAKSFHADVIGRARKVAQAAGGVLGVGSISAAEKQVLDDLESAFSS